MKPAPIDPPEIDRKLWWDFAGGDYVSVAWDVGANCGQSVPKILARYGYVHCFEPADESYAVLAAAYGDNERVTLRRAALSDESGGITLCVDPDKISTGQLVTANQFPEAVSEDPSWSLRPVPSFTGDMYLSIFYPVAPPEFVKIDVEGHEMHVLNGMRETLFRHRPALLIEIHTQDLGREVYRLLTDLGYLVETVRHPHYPRGSFNWCGHFWLKGFYHMDAAR